MILKLLDPQIVKIAREYVEDSKFAERIIEAYDDGDRIESLYLKMMEDLREQGIACNDCGHLPETGACFYCKED